MRLSVTAKGLALMPATTDQEKRLKKQRVLATRLRNHAGRWVAVRGDAVVADDDTFDGVRQKVAGQRIDRVFRVPRRRARLLL
jgi:hypothetical protein